MRIDDINMSACTVSPRRALGVAGGEGERVAVVAHDPGGYPPMSNERGLAGARKIDPTPPSKYISPSEKNFSSGAHPIVPMPDEDDFSIFLPASFEPHPAETVLIYAPKKFFSKNLDEAEATRLAGRMLAYFSRPLSGWYEESIRQRDGSVVVEKKPYTAPLPMLSEFANMHGYTERELKTAGNEFSDLGRAIEFARDVIKTNLVRKGLNEEYNPAMTVFTATNETDMKAKTEHTERRVNMNDLLDRIEKATQPMSYEA